SGSSPCTHQCQMRTLALKRARPTPTSGVPGSAPHCDLLHAPKWKQGASVRCGGKPRRSRRPLTKASFNLPGGQKDEWPDRDEEIATPQKEEPVENRKPPT